MILNKIKYLLLFTVVIVMMSACRQSKYVAEGEYLYKVKKYAFFKQLRKLTVHFYEYESDSSGVYTKSNKYITKEEIEDFIRPQENRWFKLLVYNRIDTLKMSNQIQKKDNKRTKVNRKKIDKQNAINHERNNKAKENNESHYNKKIIKLRRKKMGWRYWVSTKIGEAPVIMDSAKVAKTAKQLKLYLKQKGFYESQVLDTIYYNSKRKKAHASYTVSPGIPYTISSIKFDENPKYKGLEREYARVIKYEDSLIRVGDLLDYDLLDEDRDRFSKACRDNAYYDFSSSYIYFEVDTIGKDHQADVTIKIIDRTKELADGTKKEVRHTTFKINHVTYYVHNSDENSFKNFSMYQEKVDKLGLVIQGNNFPLLDTLNYIDTAVKKRYLLFGERDTIYFYGTFIYNEKLPISPYLLDRQNFLEQTDGGDNGWYKEYYLERSYSKLLGLDIFSSITPSVKLNEDVNRQIDISYDLTPSKRQRFSIEPNATNSSGFLGLAASINYTHKNFFGGAEKLKLSFTGGAESQPAVFGQNIDGESIKTSGRQLNTIELYPKVSFDIPKLVPMGKSLQKTLSKRSDPRTTFDLGYNFQKRSDFQRNLTEFAFGWKFTEDKSKVHHLKWQSFSFVKLNKSPEFEILLSELNDPFLLNTYNDHFSNKFEYIFEYNNQIVNKQRKGKRNYVFSTASASLSGNALNSFGVGAKDLNANGSKQLFGVPFTQFAKVDLDYRYFFKFKKSKTKSLAYRFLGGAGYAYGNSLSLPYEEGFFAGGSNDIRAWNARTLAAGGTQTWKDTSSTNTQIGDMRLEMNLEYRFQFSSFAKAALFADAGNIWKINSSIENPADDPGLISKDFVNQIALGAGFGLRLDFDFFLVRIDLAIPVHNPYMYAGERWIWEGRDQYESELLDLPTTYTSSLVKPFSPKINFGIGYPF